MKKLKIVWAFDPYAETQDSWSSTLQIMDSFAGSASEFEVVPVYILGQEMVQWVANITPPQLKLIEPQAQKVLIDKIATFSRDYLKNPKVLLSEGVSRSEDIQVLNSFLKEQNPALVIFNTHQRKGLTRFFMGSFTEAFILESTFPCLVIPPKYNFTGGLKKVLMPSSLTENERNFFERLVQGKMGIQPYIVLYSKIFHPIDAFAQSVSTALGGGWVSMESYSQEAIALREKAGREWADFAVQNGAEVKVIVDDSPADFLDSIFKVVKSENVDFLALPTSARGAEAMFLGSNAREIIRMSEIPVLVAHLEVKK